MRKILCFLFAFAVFAFVPAAAPAQQGVGSVPGPAYRINPGDDLEVSVWGDERLQKVVKVLPDGTFGFPLVGQIMAAGLLPSELERVITAALKPQYRDVVPQVTVTVKDPNGYQFSVTGKVKSPGTFTPGRYVNALEALTIAGGPTEFAQTNKIRIIRKVGPQGQLQTISVPLGDVLKGDFGQLSQRTIPPILSGDTLVIP